MSHRRAELARREDFLFERRERASCSSAAREKILTRRDRIGLRAKREYLFLLETLTTGRARGEKEVEKKPDMGLLRIIVAFCGLERSHIPDVVWDVGMSRR